MNTRYKPIDIYICVHCAWWNLALSSLRDGERADEFPNVFITTGIYVQICITLHMHFDVTSCCLFRIFLFLIMYCYKITSRDEFSASFGHLKFCQEHYPFIHMHCLSVEICSSVMGLALNLMSLFCMVLECLVHSSFHRV